MYVLNIGRMAIGFPAAVLSEYAINPMNALWPYTGLIFILAAAALLVRSVYASLIHRQSPWPRITHRIGLYAYVLLVVVMSYRFALT